MVAKGLWPPAFARYIEPVSGEVQVVLLIGGLHLIGLLGAGLLVLQCLRESPAGSQVQPRDDEDGGGGNDRRPRPAPWRPRGGGPPLPDADPARVRLRSPGLLAELLPGRQRRPLRDPGREPRRTPAQRRRAAARYIACRTA
jgi:hypothetical protein